MSWNCVCGFWIKSLIFLSPTIDSLSFNSEKNGVEQRIYYIGSYGWVEGELRSWQVFKASILYKKKPKQLFSIH